MILSLVVFVVGKWTREKLRGREGDKKEGREGDGEDHEMRWDETVSVIQYVG